MKRMAFRTGIKALFLCCAFTGAMETPRCFGADKPPIGSAKIDKSVIAALLRKGAVMPKVTTHIDLSKSFETVTQWTFVVVREEAPKTQIEDNGPIHVCFVNVSRPDCSENPYLRVGEEHTPFSTPYHLLASRVVQSDQTQANPLLLVKLCSAQTYNGNCGVSTALYRYERGADRFVRVFHNLTGQNNNEATRFVESGPLQGRVIADYPTENAPYTYWIEVYQPEKSGKYIQALRFRGRTQYADGNPLAVADSEMAEILRHLGLWKSGDALPVPPSLPRGCSHLYMRGDEEWCK